jgi:K+-sensing histidine kinase KdpD
VLRLLGMATARAFATVVRAGHAVACTVRVCEYVQNLLKVQTITFREVGGTLVKVAALPGDQDLGPVDRAALDWAWTDGQESGAGTAVLSAADWQFQPLRTSLGVLAVLGLAREDGRDPVRPDQRVLLFTLVAQAALVRERLRLKDSVREPGSSYPRPGEPGRHTRVPSRICLSA